MATRPASLLLKATLAALSALVAQGQPELRLQEVVARKGPDFVAAHAGERATVTGVASTKAVRVIDYALLPIEDGDHGLYLYGPPEKLGSINAGDRVRATGTISLQGQVVLAVDKVDVTAQGLPVTPHRVSIEELKSFRHLGRLILVEATVTMVGENSGGEFVQFGSTVDGVRVFLPLSHRSTETSLSRFSVGDKVRVVGLSSQYCPLPPHNRFFQILISSPANVTLLQPRWPVSPLLLAIILTVILFGLGLWWMRDRRMVGQRHQMRGLHALSEDILAATAPSEILRMLNQTLPQLYEVSGVRLYVAGRNATELESVPSREDQETRLIPLDSPETASGAALCYRNRALLSIPDARRSPFIKAEDETRSIMFVPMFARKELTGVLELYRSGRAKAFTADEQTAAQHLANQIATAIRLLEQQSIREQLFRSEKLAAAGRLTSAVANELQEPLESIAELTSGLLAQLPGSPAEGDLKAIEEETKRASGIVSRLVSFVRAEQNEAEPVDLHALLSGLISFRQRECRDESLSIQIRLAPDPLLVMGSQGQLEQVFLNLIVHAEQSVASTGAKRVLVATSRVASRALIEISYTARREPGSPDPFEDGRGLEFGALGLDVCRGIVQSHGGEIRMIAVPAGQTRFLVELPVYDPPVAVPSKPATTTVAVRSMTVLLVEPERLVQRQLLGMLARRGHRVVPVGSAEEGADLIERLHFDLVFCAVRLPGLNWVEFFERVRRQVGGFALLTEGYDADLSRAFAEGEGHILVKPVEESKLDRLLEGAALAQPPSHHK